MLRPEDVEYTWKLLESAAPQTDDMEVRELDDVTIEGEHPLFAVDGRGHRQLLIPMSLNRKLEDDTASSGVHITSRRMIDAGSLKHFASVMCRKPHLNELFTIIIVEILNTLMEDASQPDLTAKRVLNRWRELLERAPSEKPDMQIIVGLFGELWQLRHLVSIHPRCIAYWRGPQGDRHDIMAGRQSIEVKSSLSRTGRLVVIHGHEQLEPVPDGTLYLAVIRLERLDIAGENLSDLADALTAAGADPAVLMMQLARLGFTTHTLELCKDIRFEVREHRIYAVDDTFPRIVSSSFAQGQVPSGVIALNYTVDLSNEPPFPLSPDVVTALYYSIAGQG